MASCVDWMRMNPSSEWVSVVDGDGVVPFVICTEEVSSNTPLPGGRRVTTAMVGG